MYIYIYSHVIFESDLSSARQSRVPATVLPLSRGALGGLPLSRGGLGRRSPPSTASGWLGVYGSNLLLFRIPSHPKSIFPNPSKNNLKWSIISFKSLPKWSNIEVWRGVWAAIGRLWGCSWASSGSKEPVGRLLDASWAALGWFLRRLGRLLGGSWAVLGTNLGRLGASWRHLGGVLVGF